MMPSAATPEGPGCPTGVISASEGISSTCTDGAE